MEKMKCPICGGTNCLYLSIYYTYFRDYRILQNGSISKNYTKSDSGPTDDSLLYCSKCSSQFDYDDYTIDEQGVLKFK